eukprot:TRINITY_DN4783_c1_g1_i1.p1 TRINITY_DN4783_c1_g1~~TRINITY_DN4783_c1_g1_i1.p1  ORF type:complete len:343 (+),score=118.54 TRINITY_DN4783_c1_g1_i1:192-1220(+)
MTLPKKMPPKKCEEMFALFDEDGGGLIDAHEFGKLFNSLGYRASGGQVRELITSVMGEGSVQLDYASFVAVLAAWRAKTEPELAALAQKRALTPVRQQGVSESEVVKMQAMFDLYSSSGDTLNAADIMSLLRALGYSPLAGEIDRLLTEFDTSQLRRVDFTGYLAIFAKYRKVKGPAPLKPMPGSKKGSGTSKLSVEDINDFKDMFDIFDEDRSGSVNAAEVGNIIRSLGLFPTNKEVLGMLGEVDTDGGGTLDFQEFLPMMARLRSAEKPCNDGGTDDELLEAFAALDVDGEGVISAERLRALLTRLGEPLSLPEADDLLTQIGGSSSVNYRSVVASRVLQ